MNIEKRIKYLTGRLTASLHPKKIILFGSCAREDFHEPNDVDILVISELTKPRGDYLKDVERLFLDRDFPLDILVYSPDEVERFKDEPGSLIHEILDHGKVIYDRAA